MQAPGPLLSPPQLAYPPPPLRALTGLQACHFLQASFSPAWSCRGPTGDISAAFPAQFKGLSRTFHLREILSELQSKRPLSLLKFPNTTGSSYSWASKDIDSDSTTSNRLHLVSPGDSPTPHSSSFREGLPQTPDPPRSAPPFQLHPETLY